MATTFAFEEFDDATHDYLLGVKEKEGRGFPGIYVPVKNALPTVGCCLGVLLIGIMIPVTLMSDIILGDPEAVALLQTAVLLLGGWMIVAALRARAGRASKRVVRNPPTKPSAMPASKSCEPRFKIIPAM